jgi:hypothetical protein
VTAVMVALADIPVCCESGLVQFISVHCAKDIADSLDDGDRIGAIISDFSKAFDLVPHGRLLTKIAKSGVDSRVVVWIREFLLGRTQSQGRRAIIRGS